MRALYAYLMHGVQPVTQANTPSAMSWPFNQRWGLSLWNWAFLDDAPFTPSSDADPAINRGAYLVQGLGHCGACHTPRGIAFQEKAMSEAGRSGQLYLAGETVEQWQALSLRNLWTVEDTVQLLKTGQNRFATVSGSMTDVIHHSTQHFSDDDLLAIASYLKSLPAGKDDLPMPDSERPLAAPVDLYSSRGGLGYAQFCSDCHRKDGSGVPVCSAAGRQPHGRFGQPEHATAYHPYRLENRGDRNPLAGLHHARLRPAGRPRNRRNPQLRPQQLGQPGFVDRCRPGEETAPADRGRQRPGHDLRLSTPGGHARGAERRTGGTRHAPAPGDPRAAAGERRQPVELHQLPPERWNRSRRLALRRRLGVLPQLRAPGGQGHRPGGAHQRLLPALDER